MKKYLPILIFAVLVLLTMICSVTGIINESIGIYISLGLVTILNLTVAIIAFKHDIKVVGVLMLIFMVIGIVLLGLNIYSFANQNKNKPRFQITVTPAESPKTKIFTQDNKNYYTYNLNTINITLDEDNKKYSLEEAFFNNKIKLESLLEQAIPNDKTNGYKLYYDGGQSGLGNDSYSIVICENNNDVIFSTFNYVYTEDICHD